MRFRKAEQILVGDGAMLANPFADANVDTRVAVISRLAIPKPPVTNVQLLMAKNNTSACVGRNRASQGTESRAVSSNKVLSGIC